MPGHRVRGQRLHASADSALRRAYTAGLRKLVERIGAEDASDDERNSILTALATCVGSAVIAQAAAIDAMLPPVLEHLDAEEAYLLALIDKHLTDDEWAEVGQAAMAKTPKSLLPMAFGMVLRDAEPEHVAGLKTVTPGLAWFVLSRLGPRAYARYARRIGLDRVSNPAGTGRRGLPCTRSGPDNTQGTGKVVR
jgi:hypothetical protein